MRLSDKVALDLSAMTPAQSSLSFHPESLNTELNCVTCHDPHKQDLDHASIDACLSCHNDEHSQNFKSSAHFSLWQQEQKGELNTGAGVSCASCHMPAYEENGVTRIMHNQNHNLRPNEKMIRSICMDCHGLSFSLDALADKALIKTNFNGKPSQHINSIDMAIERSQK